MNDTNQLFEIQYGFLIRESDVAILSCITPTASLNICYYLSCQCRDFCLNLPHAKLSRTHGVYTILLVSTL